MHCTAYKQCSKYGLDCWLLATAAHTKSAEYGESWIHSTYCISLRSAHIIRGRLHIIISVLLNSLTFQSSIFLFSQEFFSSSSKFMVRMRGHFVSSSHRAIWTKAMKKFSNQTVAAVFLAKKQSLFHRNFYVISAKWGNSTPFDDRCEKYAVSNEKWAMHIHNTTIVFFIAAEKW